MLAGQDRADQTLFFVKAVVGREDEFEIGAALDAEGGASIAIKGRIRALFGLEGVGRCVPTCAVGVLGVEQIEMRSCRGVVLPDRKKIANKQRGTDVDLPSSVAEGRSGWMAGCTVVFGADHSPRAIDDRVFGVIKSVSSDNPLFAISAHPQDRDACTKHLVGVVAGFFGDATHRHTFKQDAHVDAPLFGLDHGLGDLGVGKEVDVKEDLRTSAAEALE